MAICYLDCTESGKMVEYAAGKLFFSKLGDPVHEPRDFAASCVAVHDTFSRCTNNRRFSVGHGGKRESAIAGGDGLFHFTRCRTHARAPRLIDDGAARALAGGLLSGLCIGHKLSCISCREREPGL